MRVGKNSLIGAIIAVTSAITVALLPASSQVAAQSSSSDRAIFYRLTSSYQNGAERVVFDLVVGCAVRVASYGDGGASYDAMRDPVVYAKPVQGGGALMQIVPSACLGETSDNGKVPNDFLPGVVWFERADDLSLGIAYVTEDAFENPRSKLKFLGAEIHPATRQEWEAFRPIAAQNLIDPRPLFALLPPPSSEDVKRVLGDPAALAKLWPGMSCHVVNRLQIVGDESRRTIREYWPISQPRYWMPTEEQLYAIDQTISLFGDADANPSTNYLSMGHHTAKGFPTRDRGGAIGSAHKQWDLLPATIFPLRRDEGAPWITSAILTTSTVYRRIETDEDHRGFAYCYKNISPVQLRNDSAGKMTFVTEVNGEKIFGEVDDMRQQRNRPWPFFERDEYLYYSDTFGLN